MAFSSNFSALAYKSYIWKWLSCSTISQLCTETCTSTKQILKSNIRNSSTVPVTSEAIERASPLHHDGFCFRVLQKLKMTADTGGVPSSQALHSIFPGRLEFLETLGCKTYQLLEYPQSLQLTDSELYQGLEMLNSCGIRSVSVPLLKIAQKQPWYQRNYVANKAKRYIEKLDGHVSVADFWISSLGCHTQQEILNILHKNPRLVALKSVQDAKEKLQVLTEYGITLEELKQNTHILKNVNVDEITKRCKELILKGIYKSGEPLPLHWLCQSDDVFNTIVKNHLRRQEDSIDKVKWLSKKLHYGEDAVQRCPQLLKHSLSMLKRKVPHLLDLGFSQADIVSCPDVLSFSISNISRAMKDMEEAGVDHLKISMLKTYLITKTIGNPSRSRNTLARVLWCSPNEVPYMTENSNYKDVLLQDLAILEENFKFLLECGFHPEHIHQLPVVIGHDPNVLRQHWNLLSSRDELQQHKDCLSDPVKLLNILQYFIERDINFQMTVVLKAAES